MKKLSFIFATVLFFASATVSNAQDNNDTQEAKHEVAIKIPTIALVDVEDAKGNEAGITFTFTADDLVKEAGDKLAFANKTNTELYLQYTSIVSSNKVTNSINATLVGSTIPDGMSLKVGVSQEAAKGKKGTTGTGISEQTLTSTATDVVTGIKSCYTGTQGAYGHLLTYKLVIDDTDAAYEALTAEGYSTTVLYTITEN